MENISEGVQLSTKNKNAELGVGEICQHINHDKREQISKNKVQKNVVGSYKLSPLLYAPFLVIRTNFLTSST